MTISGPLVPFWPPGGVVTSRGAVLTAVALSLAVRLDAASDRWIVLYHEYTHLVLDLTSTRAPM